MPAAVVTATSRLPVGPAGATASIRVEETTVKEVAAVPPIVTAVAPVNDVPLMVMVVPCTAAVGLNDVMVGWANNVSEKKSAQISRKHLPRCCFTVYILIAVVAVK